MSAFDSIPSSAVIAASVVGAATMYYMLKGSASSPPKFLLGQSEMITNSKENETGIIRNVKAKKQLVVKVDEHPKVTTIAELYIALTEKFADREYIGSRPDLGNNQRGNFVFKTYKEVKLLVDNFASGLANLGIKPQTNVGIYSPNCEEWKICELACYLASFTLVSLYDTLGPKAAEYILEHAQLPVVVVYNQATFDKLIAAAQEMKNKYLETIVYIQKVSDASLEKAKSLNIKTFTFAEIIKNGKENPAKITPPTESDLCSIMYTSGTTGEPKGVIITHEMVISTIAGFRAQNPPLPNQSQESYLSYLPMAHMMERVSHMNVILSGGKIGFFSHDIRLLIDDMTALKPTFVVGAPRVFQRIYDRVITTVETSGGIKKWMFYTAYEAKKRALANGQDTPFWNKLVFDKLHEKIFGGQVRAIASGSAPLSPKVHEFLRICFCPVVVEGYGLTETTAGCSIQVREDRRVNTVGPPIPSVEIKLVDVPDMNYTSKDKPPRGQIYIRGPGVTKGYYKNPKATAEAFTEDGWFKTGDIGRLNDDGSISIIDRAKNIFKMQHGEYVAPEYLETVCCRSKLVSQACVYGDSLQSYLVAIVVPDPDAVNKYAQDNGIKKDFKSLCNDPTIQAAILQDLNAVGREAKLFGFEIVKKVHLEPEPWTQENGILTPTFKLKRAECIKKYLSLINAMYAEGEGTNSL